MGKESFYAHPQAWQYQVEQWGALLLLVLIIFASLALLILAFLIPAPLFVPMSFIMLFLAAPVLNLLLTSPPVQIEESGLRLKPLFGGERFIAWEDIQDLRAYPLLPNANQEVLRQWMVGRKQYRAAEGIMLLVPSLPAPYRIAGFLAGSKGLPIIAFSNRSHVDYYELKSRLEKILSPTGNI
jgi:hypothetical protein